MASDEFLYTGLNSQSYAKESRKRKTRAQKDSYAPDAKIVFKEIKKHREIISKELGNIINIEMSPADVKSTILGLRMADQRLVQLDLRLRKILSVEQDDEDL